MIETTADFQHGMRVDRSVLTCVLITIIGRAMDVLCHGDLTFADGQIQFQGETNFHTTCSGYPAPVAAPRLCRVMAAWPVSSFASDRL